MANMAVHPGAVLRHEPSWWNDHHSRAWDRVREAFARDWAQTQADFSSTHGQELGQSLTDTLKQAVGRQPIPPRGTPNDHHSDDVTSLRYEDAEPALRYGYGASAYYFDHDVWDASLEAKLRDDWSEVDPSRDWADVREHVRRGWEAARAHRNHH